MVLALGVARPCVAASDLVRVGESGRLIYKPDARGDRIPDFAMAGYHNGAAAVVWMAVMAGAGARTCRRGRACVFCC